MKIKTLRDENLSIDDVAKMPQVESPGAKAFFEEAARVTDVICDVVSKSILATDENLTKAEVELDKMEGSRRGFDVKPEQRPSLEVETEVHDNLRPRIEAHLGRMRAWDFRKLDSDDRILLTVAMDDVADAFNRLSSALDNLRGIGFVAKTTPVTRMASKLTHGAKVSLRDDKRAEFAQVYSDEQLNSLSVVKVTDTHVQLMAEDGSNIGLVRICHVVVKS